MNQNQMAQRENKQTKHKTVDFKVTISVITLTINDLN